MASGIIAWLLAAGVVPSDDSGSGTADDSEGSFGKTSSCSCSDGVPLLGWID